MDLVYIVEARYYEFFSQLLPLQLRFEIYNMMPQIRISQHLCEFYETKQTPNLYGIKVRNYKPFFSISLLSSNVCKLHFYFSNTNELKNECDSRIKSTGSKGFS